MKLSWKRLLLACLVAGAGLQSGTAQAGKIPGFPISQPVVGAEHKAPVVSKNDAMLAPCACQACDNGGSSCCDAAPSCGCGNGACGDGCDSGCGLLGGGLLGGGCDGGCDSACGCDDGILGLGLVKKTDLCYDDFISPMTNPTYFEDPRNLSELRFIYAQHNVPLAAGGGDVNLFAMQFRARLTDKLSLIATKDGYMTTNNPLLDDGWMGVNAGLKYNLTPTQSLVFCIALVLPMRFLWDRRVTSRTMATASPFVHHPRPSHRQQHALPDFGWYAFAS